MKTIKVICLCLLFSGAVRAELISTQKVAFVDIEEIYSRFRLKELAEQELDIRKEKYAADIAAMDAKIRQLEASIALDEERIPEISTATAADIELSTAPAKSDTRPDELNKLRQQKDLLAIEARENLKNIKGEYITQIMGKIYDAVAETAEEGGYSLVIDKSKAVYGIPSTDLTEKVLKKLR